MRMHHQRSRYIYDLYYRRKAISRELYDYCIAEKYADANLIAKWKKVNIYTKIIPSWLACVPKPISQELEEKKIYTSVCLTLPLVLTPLTFVTL